ncbi:right-handed parallel beta-helix repeat-containing protein [Domibacillus aminovorans]|uniref:Right handed beta helix domain-containing protein n=1 Tax=Domibacillus aminovorans TaxID=29332 RepID=A0A177L0L1_9BACI|nr:right-handed parallel beta-helix repeat-containing protein [Domibacillus aminovorans]OAH58972.1 hypothetical protein AWH49_04730 [Domibacillus aminovorans]
MFENRNRILIALISLIITGMIIGSMFIKLHRDSEQSKSKFTSSSRNIESFEDIINDSIDDTDRIQKTIDFVNKKGGGVVTFPKGIYLIDAEISLKLKDNITLKFEKGAILKALPNNAESYEIVKIHDVENVSLLGDITIIGERKEHIGKTGEWGFGISIRGAENITIENPFIKDCWGDGIYIGATTKKKYSKRVTIINPLIENNRRQGISVISAVDLTIISPKLLNTNGTSPQGGIDFEPNSENDMMSNIKLINPETEGNLGGGVIISLKKLQQSDKFADIEIINSQGIQDGLDIRDMKNIKGTVIIDNKERLLQLN